MFYILLHQHQCKQLDSTQLVCASMDLYKLLQSKIKKINYIIAQIHLNVDMLVKQYLYLLMMKMLDIILCTI